MNTNTNTDTGADTAVSSSGPDVHGADAPGCRFLWLEITGRCQLECQHCYAESGPGGGHGVMGAADWCAVIDQAARRGVGMVQFIGGEPTLHPDLPGLVEHALAAGLRVEVFSNLVHVRPALWELFCRPGVSLATSYYSDRPGEHARITGRSSHARTRANIVEALRRGIELRAGVIDLGGGQRADAAVAELTALGVAQVGYDRLREVGRGVGEQPTSSSQLCGHCGDGVAAIGPDGQVWPCVFARWLTLGNVHDARLDTVLDGPAARSGVAELRAQFTHQRGAVADGSAGCHPSCAPSPCQPSCSPRCSPTCNPIACGPRECWPVFRTR